MKHIFLFIVYSSDSTKKLPMLPLKNWQTMKIGPHI